MNATQNTDTSIITIKPASPVDAASFARLRAAGFAWDMAAGAFIATDSEQARALAAEFSGQPEPTPPGALHTSGEQIQDTTELCDDIARATYSPEDNKIRLYPTRQLDAELYARVKAAGFKWAPKQGVFVAPMWTPARADLAESLAGELGDEDTTLAERATERAERFDEYHSKRAADAESARRGVDAIAQNIPFGQPILIGHHSERHARRDAQRIEDGMRRAVKMWDTAEYWTRRAAGAIRHAKYKELPAVRARRIKTIEAAQRKSQRDQEQSRASLALWDRDGLTLEQARAIANRVWFNVSREDGHSWTAYDVLQPDGERFKACPAWTVDQVQTHARKVYPRYIAQAQRWIDHYQNRLAYERAMLNEAGGLESDRVKPEKGGAIRCLWAPRGGWAWIVKVNKITVSILYNYGNGGRNFQRNIPMDEISEVISAAEVEAARAAGRLFETEDKIGFYLAAQTTPDEAQAIEPTDTSADHTSGEQTTSGGDIETSGEDLTPCETIAAPDTETPPANPAAAFAAMRDSLRAGVQVITAPQLFPTPAALAARMVELANIQPGARVLEPSAGTGRLLDAISAAQPDFSHLVAVEINATLSGRLYDVGRAIVCGDFLKCDAAALWGNFDRILMNPPFTNAADIQHVQHAASMLKPGGRLVALCANGPRQRAALQPLASYWEDLPAGTFAEAGTGVNVALLIIDAPAATGTDDDTRAVQTSGEQTQTGGEVVNSGEDSPPCKTGTPFDAARFYAELREILTAAGWTHNKTREHIEDGDYFVYDNNSRLGTSGGGWAAWRIFVNHWNTGTGGGWVPSAEIHAQHKTPAQVAAEIIAATTPAPSGEQIDSTSHTSGELPPVESIAPLIPGRWIPGGADKAERIAFDAALGLEVWLMDMAGKLSVIAYRGKRTKQDAYYLIKDRERALQWAAQYLADAQADAQRQAARQAARQAEKKAKRAAGHKLKVGDVLRSSWGYDQTNIDYYQVTKLIGKSMVEIREIGAERIESGNMTGECVPRPGHYIGDPMRKTVSESWQSVRIASYAHAHKIETQEVGGVKVYPVDHWTAYA